ncbi:MAG: hypothetical protein ACJA1R_002959 [Flavobacteriales bacterium]|jgi:hypothetical protein
MHVAAIAANAEVVQGSRVDLALHTPSLNARSSRDSNIRALSFFSSYRAPLGEREIVPVVGVDITNDFSRSSGHTDVRARLGLQYSLLGDSLATGITCDWENPGRYVANMVVNYYLQFAL